jgi:hypothetical protein
LTVWKLAVALPLVCPITALPFFGARAATPNMSHADPVNWFAEFIAEASDRFGATDQPTSDRQPQWRHQGNIRR